MIFEVQTEDEISACFDTLRQLRPDITRETLIPRTKSMMAEGFRMLALKHEDGVVGVLGFRIHSNFSNGRKLYVDDLIISERIRSLGFGTDLLKHAEALAKEEGCNLVHLDSGTLRQSAHRFYFANRYDIWAFHFIKNL